MNETWHEVTSYIVSIINFVIGHNFNQNVIWIPLWWKRSLSVSRIHDSRIRIRQLILFVSQKLRSRREAEPEIVYFITVCLTTRAQRLRRLPSFVPSIRFGVQRVFFSFFLSLPPGPSRDTLMINLTDSERLTFACSFQYSMCMMYVSVYWLLQLSLTSWFLLLFVLILVIIPMNKGGLP